ncbi:MAG: hypothetical protein AAF892_03435 [Cyanobacteria bacterium P01_D01_bin.71]
MLAQVTVYSMSAAGYEAAVFSGEAVVKSLTFPKWQQQSAAMMSL